MKPRARAIVAAAAMSSKRCVRGRWIPTTWSREAEASSPRLPARWLALLGSGDDEKRMLAEGGVKLLGEEGGLVGVSGSTSLFLALSKSTFLSKPISCM